MGEAGGVEPLGGARLDEGGDQAGDAVGALHPVQDMGTIRDDQMPRSLQGPNSPLAVGGRRGGINYPPPPIRRSWLVSVPSILPTCGNWVAIRPRMGMPA